MWVVRIAPEGPIPDVPARELRQAYLAAGDPEFRIRLDEGEWQITAKAGPKADRIEVEARGVPNGEAIFRAAAGGRIEKERRVVGPWEIDVFGGALEGLEAMELENPPAVLPPFPDGVEIIAEVTHDPRFRNARLAQLDRSEATALVEEFYGRRGG